MQTTIKLSQFGIAPRRRRCRLHKATFPPPSLPAFWRALPSARIPPLLSQNPNQEIVALDSNNVACLEEEYVALETCISKVLPQALTLEHGLEALKVAFKELELHPPTTRSGFIRFEVPVPPNSKDLSWLCAQPESSAQVFPQLYISKESNAMTNELDNLNKGHGIFGIGAAVEFGNLSSGSIGNQSLFQRFLMVELPNIITYGYIGADCVFESSFMKLDSGSFYFVIPQIELSEYEGVSLLTGTIAWSEDSHYSFKDALCAYHMSLIQAHGHFTACEKRSSILTRSIFNEDEITKLVFIDSASSFHCGRNVVRVEMKDDSRSRNFFIRVSPTTTFSANDTQQIVKTTFTPEDSANINALWASLIIEECVRLGLRYFCIAPGSRSSPLAVAASSHPHAVCVSCFDERSLAFHGVGYARGSGKPAVVISTSGSAVSNLIPAVVEASQDFVPILFLTADRPPELLECGANQAINQVNHFGIYARWFFNLPAPTDEINARMVLTTIDSAVNRATTSPNGPVHINCAFRDPLDASPEYWSPSCLEKLDTWILGSDPFTKYEQLQPSIRCDGIGSMMTDILQIIKGADSGILVIAALTTDSDTWSALILAQHLQWPVVADILSGVRLRKLIMSHPEYREIIFLDHFDHMLLSSDVRGWAQADTILQIGSRITSKRTSQLLEKCFPCSYILVDSHQYRHDPSHMVTHRIQSTISQFTEWLLKGYFPGRMNNKWAAVLQSFETMVASEISFQISAKSSLTEPYVSISISDFLSSKTALFIGNSMPIRDMDTYSNGLVNCAGEKSELLPYEGIKVAGNRGASGIDGLLSTATGFSVGSQKRVYCVVGDVSFLHDTNGLALLSSRMLRKPMAIIVMNNRGGAIFSFLPIVKSTEPRILNDFFYLTHDVSIRSLCAAHSIRHLSVNTKEELQEALLTSEQSDLDCVIEVQSCIDTNAEFHSILRKFASQAASHAFSAFLKSGANLSLGKIDQIQHSTYRFQLNAPLTSVIEDAGSANLYKEGFVLALTLDDGSTGYGEVAPFQAQEKDLQYLEDQLQFIICALKGAGVEYHVSLLRGSFSSWIKRSLGFPVRSIAPSIRCGLEMAMLNAIAARQQSSLFSILCPSANAENKFLESIPSIPICGLIDHKGAPKEVANIAYKLVEEGFSTLKLKVARREDPKEDALVVKEVRKKVGPKVNIRVDANRQWTYDQAIEFSSHIKGCELQYIEEPVQNENDIIKFCEETGLPVALDETVDNVQGDNLEKLGKFSHPGIVAVVIKPSFVGGFETAALIARWAHLHGKMAIVSAAFESSLSLSCYVQFARYLELQNDEVCSILNKKVVTPAAHGFGTYQWLKEDIAPNPLRISRSPVSGYMEASMKEADNCLQNFEVNQNIIQRRFTEQEVRRYQLNLEFKHFSYDIEIQEVGEVTNDNVVLFIHGFLGTGIDWVPVMKVFSRSARCIAIDLPGHGRSNFQPLAARDESQEHRLSVEDVSGLLSKLIGKIAPGKVILVGYSMGARIALHMALRFGTKVRGAMIISGSPGLRDVTSRKVRAAQDDSRASTLVSVGLKSFVESWYAGGLWLSLRQYPKFEQLARSRLQHRDPQGLAKALSGLSIGRQTSLWEDLKCCKTPLMLVYGQKDDKFRKINQDMFSEISKGVNHELNDIVEVPESGHAVHLENPLALVRLIRQFLTNIEVAQETL